jgi:class 3 adenylate cyclase/tetratricopeptide (TPR) repeat protein
VQVCPNCGEENPDRFRLCGICGTKLVVDVVSEPVRKTVTIVFSDLKGSTSLAERLDTESLREVLNVYFTEMKAVLERHGGTVEKFIGDAVMAVFGLPKLHEDDGLRAVRAAADMQRALVRLNERFEAGWGVRLENRTGVNTGEVVAGDVTGGQRLVTGDAVNTAARLEQAAPTMEVLIGESTYRLVRNAVVVEPVEPLSLKGKAQLVSAYRLIGLNEQEEGIARRLDAPMVGRSHELSILRDALDLARRGGSRQAVTVLAPAGTGKSRLLREFLGYAAREGALTLRGRCLPYGDGITFWPLAEIVRGAAGISDDDMLEDARRKLAELVGAGEAEVEERLAAVVGFTNAVFPVEETFWAAGRLFDLLAADRPVVAVIDDIHWAERTFLDLLRFVLDREGSAPVVLACSSRHDIVEDHPDWLEERSNARTIRLEPLSEEESALVIENLLGSTEFDEEIRRRVTEAAEGNPLFVEQMLSMLIDDGVLAREESGRWTLVSDLGRITIPPTINALLTARLDHLGAADRAVIERAAVVGHVFYRAAVEAIVAENLLEQVPRSFASLVSKELVGPHAATSFAGQEAFRFLHILIRDAAYHGLLKRTRATLHVRFVDWLEDVASDRVTEFEEIRGHHLEQAYVILTQLGPVDGEVARVGARGSGYLASAGHRALARGDMPAAASLLQRAASLLQRTDRGRPKLLIQSGEALIETGEFGLAETLLTAAAEEAVELGDQGLEIAARLVWMQLRYTTNPDRGEEELSAELDRAIPQLERLGDHLGLARAWRLRTFMNYTAGRYGRAEQAALRAIDQAKLGGDRLMETRFLTALGMCALYGPTPVPEAIERCRELLGKAESDHRTTSVLLCVLSRLEAMQGRFGTARDLYRRSRATLEEFGWRLYAALTSLDSGPVEMLAGDPVAAEAELRADYEALLKMGERNYISTTAGLLAEALYQQGRYDEAERFASVCREIAAPDDVASQFHWRSVSAKVLARLGSFVEGEALAREAVTTICRSDEPDSQGTALLDLSEVLVLAGKPEESHAAAVQAADIFQAKGNTVLLERARRALAEAEPRRG